MPLSRDEVLALVDEVNVAVAEVIANFAQLKEGMVDKALTDAAKEKVERLKQDTLVAKERLSDLKDRQRHKREVEQTRKEHERERSKTQQTEGKNSGMVTLRAVSGRVVGYMRVMSKDQTDYFSASGKLVSREVGNLTYASGKAVYRGRLGLLALCQSLRK